MAGCPTWFGEVNDMISKLSAYVALTKPRLVSMSLITMAVGFAMGDVQSSFSWALLAAILGTGLVASGACVLNHYLERDADSQMERTKHRAIPSGIIPPLHALTYGLYLILAGLAVLLWKVNVLTAFLVLLSAFSYVVIYTSLKKFACLNTTAGRFAG